MLKSENYEEDRIEILINIDGLPIYRNSDFQFWPVLMKIHHEQYISKPGAVALFCGDSKPNSMEEFLEDFVEEVNKLILNGLTILGKTYTFVSKDFHVTVQLEQLSKLAKGMVAFTHVNDVT